MLYPVFADLSDKSVLVVGGGIVAERKVKGLLRTGARLVLVADGITPALQHWRNQGCLVHHARRYRDDDLDGIWLVLVASDDKALEAMVADAAARRQILCNVVDNVRHSTVQSPSVVERLPLQIAISSGGSVPLLASRLREQIEALVDEHLGTLANWFRMSRPRIKAAYPDTGTRRRFYEEVLDGPVLELLRQGQPAAAQAIFESALVCKRVVAEGQCTLIGTGQGTGEQITLQALRVLNGADVVLTGRDTQQDIIDKVRRDATLQDVGELLDLFESSGRLPVRLVRIIVDHVARRRRVVIPRVGDGTHDRLARRLRTLSAKHHFALTVVPGLPKQAPAPSERQIPQTSTETAADAAPAPADCADAMACVTLP